MQEVKNMQINGSTNYRVPGSGIPLSIDALDP